MTKLKKDGYKIEEPQKRIIDSGLEAGASLESVSELSGAPSYRVMEYAENNGIDYSHQDQVNPQELFEQDLEPREAGQILHGYLKEWESPREIGRKLDVKESECREFLATYGIITSKGANMRQRPEERVLRENSKRHISFSNLTIEEELENVQREMINGEYVKTSELSLEEYVDAMEREIRDSRNMAEVISDLTGTDSTGLAEEICEIRRRKGRKPTTPYNFEYNMADLTRQLNMNRIVSTEHENLQKKIRDVKR